MLFRILIISVFINFSFADVEVLGTYGKTYPFAEKDFLSDIHSYIKNNKKEIKKRLDKISKKMKKKIKNFKPENIDPLTPATKDRVFYPDMRYTLQYDIKDQYGKIIYPKGYTFNPTKYVKLSYGIVVINANRKKEVEWLLKSPYIHTIAYRIFLTDGSWYEMYKKLNQPVFYALPVVEKRFKLKHTPSIITQIGSKIQVKEICIDCRLNHLCQ